MVTFKEEFINKWSPPEGVSTAKIKAALKVALEDATLKEISERLGISYNMLRKWNSQAQFRDLVATIRHEFVKQLKARIEREVQERWKSCRTIPKIGDLSRLFRDSGEYNKSLLELITQEAWDQVEGLKSKWVTWIRGTREIVRESLITADIATVLWWITDRKGSLEELRACFWIIHLWPIMTGYCERLKEKIDSSPLPIEDRKELLLLLEVFSILMRTGWRCPTLKVLYRAPPLKLGREENADG
ncbi:hypothetical protein DRP77_06205 [Candidatus Poribacteria bacterium]|nr:MAG: hypothetical protein DRP77_06205 [Candidatus Poribacteria bacterium]